MFSPLTGGLFGTGAIREKAQRGLMHPRRDAIGYRPDLPVADDGAVECRLLSPATEVEPGSDAARWWLVLYPAPDFGFVEALQDDFQTQAGSAK
jgi:hypothetical protein